MSWSMGSTMSDSWARGKSFVVFVVVIGFSVSRERLRSVGWGKQSLMQYEWLVCLVVYWHWLRQIHAKRPRPDRAVGVEDSAGQMNFSEIYVVSIYASLDGSAMRTKVWSQWMVHLPPNSLCVLPDFRKSKVDLIWFRKWWEPSWCIQQCWEIPDFGRPADGGTMYLFISFPR